jgi:heme-degrading monooxygenase HmoA
MSVIVTLYVDGDGATLERAAQGNPERMQKIVGRAKELGLIAHRFYASDGGKLMVVDEWPDAASFQEFFSSMESEIGPFMQEAGITDRPEVTVWRKLETGDEVGWE